jgi:hypothetical protein
VKVYRKLHQSSCPIPHSKAATSANKTPIDIRYPHPFHVCLPGPNSKSRTQKYKRGDHVVTPRKLRRDTDEDTSETNSDAVFQGLQAAYCRFASNQSVFVKLSQELGKKLEKIIVFVCIALCRTCHQQEKFSTEDSTEAYSMQFLALYNIHIMLGLHYPER